MTTETINKIREVLGEKWPHKTYSPGLGYKTRRCNLLRLDVDPYYPEPTWFWVGLGKCDVDEARNALTLAMLDYATTPGERGGHVITQVSNLDGSDRAWVVINSEDPVPKNKSLFDLLVEVVTKENK